MPFLPKTDIDQNLFLGQTADKGHYRFVDVLGSGGFGVVYRTRATDSKQDLAVKVVAQRSRSGKRAIQLRELDYHSRVCDHPNIVTFHRWFAESGFFFFVFDACLGGDLFTAITERHLYFYNDERARNAFSQILDAVGYCHSMGIAHRDLKPENFLLSADGDTVLLADFGLATMSSLSETFGVGSTFYMAPEVIRADVKLKQYSPKHSDIWALGVILMNMLTGRSPWRAAVHSEGCYVGFMQDPLYLRTMLPLSRPTTALIGSILQLNPLLRLSIKDIKDEIMNIPTFFMSELEVSRASSHVQEIVARTLPIARANISSLPGQPQVPKMPVKSAYAPPRPPTPKSSPETAVQSMDAPSKRVDALPPTPKLVPAPTPGNVRSQTTGIVRVPTPGPGSVAALVEGLDSDDAYLYDSPDPDSPLTYVPPTRRAAPTRAPLQAYDSSSDSMSHPPSLFAHAHSDSDSSNDAMPSTPQVRSTDVRGELISIEEFALPEAMSTSPKGRPSVTTKASAGNVPVQPTKHASRSFHPRKLMRHVIQRLRVDRE